MMVKAGRPLDIAALHDALRLAAELWPEGDEMLPPDLRPEYLEVRLRFLAVLRDVEALKTRLT